MPIAKHSHYILIIVIFPMAFDEGPACNGLMHVNQRLVMLYNCWANNSASCSLINHIECFMCYTSRLKQQCCSCRYSKDSAVGIMPPTASNAVCSRFSWHHRQTSSYLNGFWCWTSVISVFVLVAVSWVLIATCCAVLYPWEAILLLRKPLSDSGDRFESVLRSARALLSKPCESVSSHPKSVRTTGIWLALHWSGLWILNPLCADRRRDKGARLWAYRLPALRRTAPDRSTFLPISAAMSCQKSQQVIWTAVSPSPSPRVFRHFNAILQKFFFYFKRILGTKMVVSYW